MFIAFEVAESQHTGIFGGIFNILTKPKARMEAREALGAAYGVIVAPTPSNASDWRRIAALAGRHGDALLLPEGLVPPPPLKSVVDSRFSRRLMLGTAIEIVKRTRMPMYRRVAGLVDEDGEYADFLFPLLHHYTTVKVLTKKQALYEAQSERLMEDLGAPVTVCDDYASFSDCVLILAPKGVKTADRLPCPVMSERAPEVQRASDFITNLRYVPANGYAGLCPAGIDPHSFFAALYDYCGVDCLGDVAARMTFRYSDADLTQVVHAVMKASGTFAIF